MQVKLKYALPLAQITLALGLLWWSQVQFEADMRIMDMPGPAPAFTLLIAINGPAVLPRAFWANYLSTLWDDLALIAAVGLLWYWIALNIDAWRKRRIVVMFSWTPLRLAGDLLLVVAGMFFGSVCVWEQLPLKAALHGVRGEALLNYLPQRLPWFIAVTSLLLAWSLALIYFFGRDFIHCILRKNPAPASPA